MNSNSSSQKIVAIGILAFCLIAVILGIVKLSKTPTEVKATGSEERMSGTFLGGTGDRLAYISLNGMIIEDAEDTGLFNSESSAVKARRLLHFAAKDPSVKGVLLRINSPGGTVGMSQELYHAVLAVRKEKPVVVSMGDVAASGGYYTAAAADKIVANPGTLTASIGVILQSMNVEGLLKDKLGVKTVTVKSGQFKDILSPYRPSTEAEMKLLQGLIDDSYQQFLTAVVEGRTRDIEDPQLKAERIQRIKAVADGRIVIGEVAKRAGLVDELGTQEDAKVLLQDLAGDRFDIKNPKKLTLQEYETPFSLWQLFGANGSIKLPQLSSLAGMEKEVLPLTLRYPNQPLWLMESYQ